MELFNVNENPTYDIHNPIGLKYLTRLPVGLSHLRAHKYQHKFSYTATQYCSFQHNMSQTVEHYQLFGPQYSQLRYKLFEKLKLITSLLTLVSSLYLCNMLLYCNPFHDFHTKKKIVELTISFIISSKRFKPPFISDD